MKFRCYIYFPLRLIPVTWQNEYNEAKGYYTLSLGCYMALYMLRYSSLFLVCRSICTPYAVHNARIVDNLGKAILNCSLVCMQLGTLAYLVPFVHLNDLQKPFGFCL